MNEWAEAGRRTDRGGVMGYGAVMQGEGGGRGKMLRVRWQPHASNDCGLLYCVDV